MPGSTTTSVLGYLGDGVSVVVLVVAVVVVVVLLIDAIFLSSCAIHYNRLFTQFLI